MLHCSQEISDKWGSYMHSGKKKVEPTIRILHYRVLKYCDEDEVCLLRMYLTFAGFEMTCIAPESL